MSLNFIVADLSVNVVLGQVIMQSVCASYFLVSFLCRAVIGWYAHPTIGVMYPARLLTLLHSNWIIFDLRSFDVVSFLLAFNAPIFTPFTYKCVFLYYFALHLYALFETFIFLFIIILLLAVCRIMLNNVWA